MGELDGRAEVAERMFEVFAGDGLAPPAVPVSLRSSLKELGDWQWGTIDFDPMEHYLMSPHLEWLATSWDRSPLYLFSHAGHGLNSYSLNATVAIGDTAVYAQALYGGAYNDRDHDREQADALFRRVDTLMTASHDDRGVRWLVVSSSFRMTHALVDLADEAHLGESVDRSWSGTWNPLARVDASEVPDPFAAALHQLGGG